MDNSSLGIYFCCFAGACLCSESKSNGHSRNSDDGSLCLVIVSMLCAVALAFLFVGLPIGLLLKGVPAFRDNNPAKCTVISPLVSVRGIQDNKFELMLAANSTFVSSASFDVGVELCIIGNSAVPLNTMIHDRKVGKTKIIVACCMLALFFCCGIIYMPVLEHNENKKKRRVTVSTKTIDQYADNTVTIRVQP